MPTGKFKRRRVYISSSRRLGLLAPDRVAKLRFLCFESRLREVADGCNFSYTEQTWSREPRLRRHPTPNDQLVRPVRF